MVACGSEHSLAIASCGQLFTWGLAGAGELGRPEEGSANTAFPRPVTPWQPSRMVSMSAGAHHSLCISDCGSVWSCGRGHSGQLGAGNCKDSFLLQRVHLRSASPLAVPYLYGEAFKPCMQECILDEIHHVCVYVRVAVYSQS